MQWHFAEQTPGMERRGPQEGELFRSDSAAEDEYAGTDALVREVIQNSTDAHVGGEPLRVRFAIHGPADAPPASVLKDTFGRLRPALEAKDVPLAGPLPKAEPRFLVVEDFATRGLCGDPAESRDPPEGSRKDHDFYWFWRNVGRSAKTGEDLGRWGLGKTVYRAASEIDCMLGLTVRRSDGRRLLFGKCVLAIHDFADQEYAPEGYWHSHKGDNGVPMPLEDSAALDEFAARWRLTRGTDEPGLSVVVPYANERIRGVELLKSVCVGFFVPILRGDLIVEVACPEVGEVRVDAGTIEKVVADLAWDGHKRPRRDAPPPVAFARDCLKAERVASKDLGTSAVKALDEDAFAEADLARLRKDYADGKLVAAVLRLPTDAGHGPGEVLVHLRKTAAGPSGKRPQGYAVREGMTIPHVKSPTASGKGAQVLMLVPKQTTDGGPNPLAEMLGDSEGPSHVNWDRSAELLKKRWPRCGSRVESARRAADMLAELVDPPTSEADHSVFADLLPRAEQPGRKKPEGQGDPPPRGFPDSPPRWFDVSGRKTGFRIAADAKTPRPAGAELRVELAYDTAKGDAVKRWHEADFDVRKKDSVQFSGKGVTVRPVAGNVFRVLVEEDAFRLTAEGFDEDRDLLVRTSEVLPKAAAKGGETA